MDSNIISMEIDLTLSGGSFGSVGRAELFLHYRALHFADVDEGKLQLLTKQVNAGRCTWEESTVNVTHEQSIGILETLRELGLSGSPPDLQPVPTTADFWHKLSVVVRVDEVSTAIEVEISPEGIEGSSLHAFRKWWRQLDSITAGRLQRYLRA